MKKGTFIHQKKKQFKEGNIDDDYNVHSSRQKKNSMGGDSRTDSTQSEEKQK